VLKRAVMLGIKSAGGVGAIVGVVAVIILELLIYLLHGNKKSFIGLLFNNTTNDLVVKNWREGVDGAETGDLFMAWGRVDGFMEVHVDGLESKPAVQLQAKSIVGGDIDYIVQCGIISATKNFGLKGAEGVLVATPLDQELPRFALLFECPYFEDNGVNVAIDSTVVSARALYDRLNDSRGTEKSIESEGYAFTARVADPRGGEALGLAVLDQL